MLKKGFRLRKKEDFERVFRFGKPLFFSEIGCRYLVNDKFLRLGFSFGKKHLPLAVDRNRLRRVLSEAFFEAKKEWPKSVDIVFFTVRKPKKVAIAEARKIINTLFQNFKKAKII